MAIKRRVARFRVKKDAVGMAKGAILEFVDGISASEPGTTRYESWVEEDGVSFVHLMEFASEEAEAGHRKTAHVGKFVDVLYPLCDVTPAFTGVELVAASDSSETRRVVMGYFSAWTEKRTDEAFALLADDLRFEGPSASYRTAAEFKKPLEGFAAMTKGARVVELLVDGDRAALLYDCDLPKGTVRIASFFRVAGGKITSYDTRFDPTVLR